MADKKSTIQISNDIVKNCPALAIHTASDQLYMYDQDLGYYREVSDREMGKMIRAYCVINSVSSQFNKALTTNVAHAIETAEEVVEVEAFNNYDSLVNFSNGYIDTSEEELPYTLHPHTEEKFFTSASATKYDPKANSCPRFIQFLQDTFRNRGKDNGYDSEMVEQIIMLGGYLLYPKNVIESMFFFIGGGANGKGVLVNEVFQRLFPKDLQSNVPLDIMANAQSADRINVATSRINFANENTKKEIDTEQLKNITGGDVVAFKRLYKRPLEVKPNCKILVSANQLPRLKDTSHGTERRVTLFEFPNKFVKPEEYATEVDPEEFGIYKRADKEELSKILKEEMPSIVNLFLKGLNQLKSNGWNFPSTKNTTAIKQEWKEESDNIGEWLRTTYKIAMDGNKSLIKTKEIIAEWIDENGEETDWMPPPRHVNKRIYDIFRLKPNKVNATTPAGNPTSTTAFNLARRRDSVLSSESSEEIANEINGQMTL